MKTYKDIYEFPLKMSNDEEDNMIYDNKNQIIAEFFINEKSIQYHILNVINGLEECMINKTFEYMFDNIWVGTKSWIYIRGWSNLIRNLKFSPDEACNIQDTFGEFILNKLNNK